MEKQPQFLHKKKKLKSEIFNDKKNGKSWKTDIEGGLPKKGKGEGLESLQI